MTDTTSKKVLIIEDDDQLRANLEELFYESGYKVSVAQNGAEGLKSAKNIIPDIIICDIMMPEIDGYEVAEELNRQKELPKIPFIFLTAKAELKDFRKGMSVGADDYVVKPFRAAELLQVVANRIERIEAFKKSAEDSNLPKNEDKELKIDERILVKYKNRNEFIRVSEIIYIQAEGEYSKIHTADKTFLLRRVLKMWEKLLPERYFIRVHRSQIINIDKVERIETTSRSTYLIYLQNIEDPVLVSQRYAPIIRAKIVK